jgi:sulfur-oxidizing protein SoxZ
MASVLVNIPKKMKKGEIFEIKSLISHIMETGFRPGTNGRIIPRNIIEHFTCSYNGVEIFRMTLSPAIAANPFIVFSTVATESGTIVLKWTGDEGFAAEETATIVVE